MNSDTERPALDADAIRSAVVRPRGSWRSFDVVAETGSTNADLLARARSGTDINGAVLAAEHQTAGRGRNGRQWTTPPRSQIAVSVGIDTTGVPSTAWGLLPLATGVAVVDAISAVTGVEAKLKWPNDVLVDTGKLAGILAEVASPAPTVVIGTGLNVSVMPDDVPDSVATSLAMLTDAPRGSFGTADGVPDPTGDRVESWRAAGGADDRLLDDYRQCSGTLGTAVRVLLPGDRQLLGDAVDIDESGRLLIDSEGERITVAAGDVTHLRPA